MRGRGASRARPALPDLAAIRAAHARIAPARASHAGADLPLARRGNGRALFFKCENFQKVGAFKARGATNAVFSLAGRRGAARRGHAFVGQPRRGAGLCGAAARHPGVGRDAGEFAPKVKQDNVRRFGATIRFCAPTSPRARRLRRGAGGDRRDADPSVRRLARDRRAGDGGARAPRSASRTSTS